MAGKHSAQRVKAKAKGRRQRAGVEPYKWLGAGAVALGLGVAVANGTGIAYADDGTGSAPSSASSTQRDRGTESGGDEGGASGNDAPNAADNDNDTAERDGDDGDDTRDGDDESTDDTAESDDDEELDESLEAELGDDEIGMDDGAAVEEPTTQRAATPVDEPLEPEVEVVGDELVTEEDDPVVPESPVSEHLPELEAPVVVDAPLPPPAPPAAPTLNELVVAAYRPTNQRAATVAPVSMQTTGQAAPAGTPPLAAAAAPSGVIGRIDLGTGVPYTVIAGPDGRMVYVVTFAVPAGASLPVSTAYGIDTRTNRVVGEPISVGYVPPSTFSTAAKPVTFSPDGKRVYLTSVTQGTGAQISSRVLVIDAATGRAVGDPIEMGSTVAAGLVVSPDGRRLYTANTDSTVTVIDLEHGNAAVATVPIGILSSPGVPGGASLDIVISQNDAQTVYIADYAERSVYVLDPVTNTVDPDPVLIDGYPVSLALSPDGSRLFVNTITFIDPLSSTANQANLVIVDTSTKAIVGSPVSYGPTAQSPATNGVTLVSPDGRYVYTESFTTVSGSPSGTVWKIDTVTGSATGLVSGVASSTPVLSPDGTRLYVPAVTVVDGAAQAAVGAVSTSDGTMLTRIPIDAGVFLGTAVSPDGTRLYLGQVLMGADPTDLGGQLAVIDTGTSNTVTPPKAVNPIAMIIRNVTNAVRASVQTIAHALQQSVATVSKALDALGENARQSIVGFGQQVANAVQTVVQIARTMVGSLVDTATSLVRNALNFQSGVVEVVRTIPDAIAIGLKQAQRETQKRLDDLRSFAKNVQGGLGRAADTAAKAVAPVAKRIDGLVKIARVSGPIGVAFAVYDLFFGGPKVS